MSSETSSRFSVSDKKLSLYSRRIFHFFATRFGPVQPPLHFQLYSPSSHLALPGADAERTLSAPRTGSKALLAEDGRYAGNMRALLFEMSRRLDFGSHWGLRYRLSPEAASHCRVNLPSSDQEKIVIKGSLLTSPPILWEGDLIELPFLGKPSKGARRTSNISIANMRIFFESRGVPIELDGDSGSELFVEPYKRHVLFGDRLDPETGACVDSVRTVEDSGKGQRGQSEIGDRLSLSLIMKSQMPNVSHHDLIQAVEDLLKDLFGNVCTKGTRSTLTGLVADSCASQDGILGLESQVADHLISLLTDKDHKNRRTASSWLHRLKQNYITLVNSLGPIYLARERIEPLTRYSKEKNEKPESLLVTKQVFIGVVETTRIFESYLNLPQSNKGNSTQIFLHPLLTQDHLKLQATSQGRRDSLHEMRNEAPNSTWLSPLFTEYFGPALDTLLGEKKNQRARDSETHNFTHHHSQQSFDLPPKLSELRLFQNQPSPPVFHMKFPALLETCDSPWPFFDPRQLEQIRSSVKTVVPKILQIVDDSSETTSLCCRGEEAARLHRKLFALADDALAEKYLVLQVSSGEVIARRNRGSIQIATNFQKPKTVASLHLEVHKLENSSPRFDIQTMSSEQNDPSVSTPPTTARDALTSLLNMDAIEIESIEPQKLDCLEGTFGKILGVSFEDRSVLNLSPGNHLRATLKYQRKHQIFHMSTNDSQVQELPLTLSNLPLFQQQIRLAKAVSLLLHLAVLGSLNQTIDISIIDFVLGNTEESNARQEQLLTQIPPTEDVMKIEPAVRTAAHLNHLEIFQDEDLFHSQLGETNQKSLVAKHLVRQVFPNRRLPIAFQQQAVHYHPHSSVVPLIGGDPLVLFRLPFDVNLTSMVPQLMRSSQNLIREVPLQTTADLTFRKGSIAMLSTSTPSVRRFAKTRIASSDRRGKGRTSFALESADGSHMLLLGGARGLVTQPSSVTRLLPFLPLNVALTDGKGNEIGTVSGSSGDYHLQVSPQLARIETNTVQPLFYHSKFIGFTSLEKGPRVPRLAFELLRKASFRKLF